jgi:hypothetical protein
VGGPCTYQWQRAVSRPEESGGHLIQRGSSTLRWSVLLLVLNPDPSCRCRNLQVCRLLLFQIVVLGSGRASDEAKENYYNYRHK